MNRAMSFRIAGFFAVFLTCALNVSAQSDPSLVMDQVLGGTGGKLEHVELSNGGASLSIPLDSVKGRGINFTFRLNYSSKYFYMAATPSGNFWMLRYPWKFSTPTTFRKPRYSQSVIAQCAGGFSTVMNYNFIFTLPDGSEELTPNLFGQDGCNVGVPGNVVAYSTDLTSLMSDGSTGVVKLRDGSFPDGDSNGNKITEQDPNAQTTNYLDSVGRQILSTSNVTFGTGSQAVTYPNALTLIDGRKITLVWQTILVTTNFAHPANAQNITNLSIPSLQEIDLPNNTAWKFQYGSDPNCPQIGNYGQLAKVIFPQGGYVRYCYAVQSNFVNETGGLADSLVLTNRYESPDGTAENATAYSYAPTLNASGFVTQRAVTVTKPPHTVGQTSVSDVEVHTYHDFNVEAGKQEVAQEFYEVDVDYRSGSTQSLRKIHKDWQCDSIPKAVIFLNSLSMLFNLGNCRVTTATTTALDGSTPLTSQAKYQYDMSLSPAPGTSNYSYTTSFGNITQTLEYDWGTNGAPGPPLRETDITYLTTNPANGNISYTVPDSNRVNLPTLKIVKDGTGNILAQTQYEYDGSALATTSGVPQHDYSSFPASYRVRGNLTKEMRWLNTTGTWLTTVNTYNDLGNRLTTTDPGGHITSFDYTDNFTDAVNRNTQAYQTTVTFPQTGSIQHIEHKSYFYNTGLNASFTDQNAQTTNYAYETLNRPSSISYVDGGKTSYSYNDVAPVSVTTTTAIDTANNLVKTEVHDGLDRVKQTQLKSDPEGATYTDITYDALGRKSTGSNPYRSTSDATYGITTTQYDSLDRVVLLIPPDGTTSSNNITTSYCANAALTTDQAGKWRRTITDGLGRAVEVDEPNGLTATITACQQTGDPVMVTRYSYDALDNLICLEQHGTVTGTGCSSPASSDATSAWRVRRYTYNSLSQLTQMTNPETGTTKYSYDNDGNVLTKTDGRNITVTHGYDALHRITSDTYSNGDPSVAYHYDEANCLGQSACYNINHRTSMTDGPGSEAWSYDKKGRPVAQTRTTNAVTKQVVASYNLAGAVTNLIYPDGRSLAYTYSTASRPLSVTDQGDQTQYVAGTMTQYAPHGSIGATAFMIRECVLSCRLYPDGRFSETYNSRLQPSGISAVTRFGGVQPKGNNGVLNLSYNYLDVNGHNNGTVRQITNNLDGTRTQSFTYDQLNRLSGAVTQGTSGTSCWGQQFSYDSWSNLTGVVATQCTAPQFSPAYNLKNQVSLVGAVSFGYDSAGNITQDGTSNNYHWNAEEMLASAAGVTYSYDGDGRRVQKSSGTIYWYGPGNEIIEETDSSGNLVADYLYFAGRRFARRSSSGSIIYYAADQVGTTRVIRDSSGTLCFDSDYYPFGGEINFVNSCPQNYKFSGKERDTETQLDYFGARYYSSSYGRFLNPDLVQLNAARLSNPQSINLYAYALNNPLSFVDPDGKNALDVLMGIGTGLVNFAVDTGSGLKAAVQHPSVIITGTIDTLKTAGQAYFTSEGRSQLSGQWRSLSTQDKAAVITEALSIGTVTVLGPKYIPKAITRVSSALKATLTASEAAGEVAGASSTSQLSNSALVVRGGISTADRIAAGAESIDSSGAVQGLSVQSADGASLEELAGYVPHKQIGVTTVGEVRALGGDVVPTPRTGYPLHCDLCGLTPEDAATLLKQMKNPNPGVNMPPPEAPEAPPAAPDNQ